MTYTYLNETIQYSVIYKRRKTMGIYIDVYGNIELRVPKDTSDEMLQKIIETKWAWIIGKQQEMKQRTDGFKPKEFLEGETFLYLGKMYPLLIKMDADIQKDIIEFRDNQIVLKTKVSDPSPEQIQLVLRRFYYKECKRLVEEKIKKNQRFFNSKPSGISISDDKSKWGSCDSKRRLAFNWKLAMSPDDVIEYIVIHEMSHLVHMNHDRSFWRLVGKLVPDYEDKQKWLMESAWKMTL